MHLEPLSPGSIKRSPSKCCSRLVTQSQVKEMLLAWGNRTRATCLILGSEVAYDPCHLYAAVKVDVPIAEAGTFRTLHSVFQ